MRYCSQSCRLSFMLTGVCVISALFYGVTLVLAGGLGQSCRPNGNLSQILRLVVDDNRTWRGVHLLGQAVLGNASYPLTFEGFLSSCQQNCSLYQSLKLREVLKLDDYFFVPFANMVKMINNLPYLPGCESHPINCLKIIIINS